MTLSLHHALSILSFFLTLILVAKVLSERRAPGSTMAWLLIMGLIPYVGIPLYLLVGDRKVKRIANQKEKLYLNLGAPKTTSGNEFTSLPTGEEAYKAILLGINTAKKSIHFATFILGNDPVGQAILGALIEKAKQGVEVRLLLDGVGTVWFPKWRLRQLRRAGGDFAIFVPLFRLPFSGHSNLRNHRKMVLLDGQEAILGGMNATEEYMGPTPDPKRWTDFSFHVRGSALTDFENIFHSDWTFASKKILEPTPQPAPAGTTPMQAIASGPDVAGDPLYDALLIQIFAAKKRIWIATPYFIPDESLARALELACRRGVDVRIVVPAHSNHRLADLCRGSYLRQIDHAGGQLCFFQPGMMHAKMTVMDDSFALIGSANLDMRSLLYNYEVGVLLTSKPSVEVIANWFESIFKATHIVHPQDHWGSSSLDGIGRIFGPLL